MELNREAEKDPDFEFFKHKKEETLKQPKPNKTLTYLIGVLVAILSFIGLFFKPNPPKPIVTTQLEKKLDKDVAPSAVPKEVEDIVPLKPLKEPLYLGNQDNISKDDLQKIDEFQKKLMKNNLSEQDIDNSIKTILKIQKDYHKTQTK